MRTWRNNISGAVMTMFVFVFLTGSVLAGGKNEMKSSEKKGSNNVNILNGMDFRGKMGTFGDQNGKDEEIVFENGTFHSALCDAYGFGPSKYTVAKNPEGNILFRSEAANKNGDKMIWHGIIKLDETGLIKRDNIEAYATYVPVAGESVLYWMNGEASKQSMKYSGKEIQTRFEKVSKKDDQ
jgi:hypothetical protein